MKINKFLALLLSVLLTMSLFVACSAAPTPASSPTPAPAAPAPAAPAKAPEAPTGPADVVRLAIHGNTSGAIIGIALKNGYFKEENIDPKITVVESGPVEMAAMRSDNPTLDAGFIGAGVAWNPIDSAGNHLSFIYMENLGNAEMLLANKSLGIDDKSTPEQIYNAIKGQTVHMEVGTTPGSWFKNVIAKLNEGKPEAEQLWIYCETSAYLEGYKAPNNTPELKVNVVNTANTNLPAGMASSGSSKIMIAAGFAPVTSTIIKTNKDVVKVATAESLTPDATFPGTWVARTKWLDENPDVAQRLVNVLVKASDYRRQSEAAMDESMREGEKITGMPDGAFDANVGYWLSKAEMKEWFKDDSSRGYKYMEALYNSKLPNVPAGNAPRSFKDTLRLEFMLNAVK